MSSAWTDSGGGIMLDCSGAVILCDNCPETTVAKGANCMGCVGDTPATIKATMPAITFTAGNGYNAHSLAAGTYEMAQDPTSPCCFWIKLPDAVNGDMWISITLGTTSINVWWCDTGPCGGSFFVGVRWSKTLTAGYGCMTLNETVPESFLKPNLLPPQFSPNPPGSIQVFV